RLLKPAMIMALLQRPQKIPNMKHSVLQKKSNLAISFSVVPLENSLPISDVPDILTTDVWITIGFTYDASKQKYCLIKERNGIGLCLACTMQLEPEINEFCWRCKAPRPVDWTTGNKSLDSFIMESRKNTKNVCDAYIEYSLLLNIQEMTSLRHGCTHISDWQSMRVIFKPIA